MNFNLHRKTLLSEPSPASTVFFTRHATVHLSTCVSEDRSFADNITVDKPSANDHARVTKRQRQPRNVWTLAGKKTAPPEQLKVEQLKVEQLKVEQLKVEQLKAEQLKAEQLKAEQLKAEQLKAEHLKKTAHKYKKSSTIPLPHFALPLPPIHSVHKKDTQLTAAILASFGAPHLKKQTGTCSTINSSEQAYLVASILANIDEFTPACKIRGGTSNKEDFSLLNQIPVKLFLPSNFDIFIFSNPFSLSLSLSLCVCVLCVCMCV